MAGWLVAFAMMPQTAWLTRRRQAATAPGGRRGARKGINASGRGRDGWLAGRLRHDATDHRAAAAKSPYSLPARPRRGSSMFGWLVAFAMMPQTTWLPRQTQPTACREAAARKLHDWLAGRLRHDATDHLAAAAHSACSLPARPRRGRWMVGWLVAFAMMPQTTWLPRQTQPTACRRGRGEEGGWLAGWSPSP
jgi:hypothetical protein